MSTIAEKLQLTLATKENIKKAIEKKGISVGDAPFHEYPSKIASIGIDDSEWREPDWIDIQQVRLLDTEDYIYKSIYLLDDSDDTIYLQGGDAYKTSDSNELITEDGAYTFTGAGDVECSKDYNTRWVIIYKNTAGSLHPGNIQHTLIYAIIDGCTVATGFQSCTKLKYVEFYMPVSSISNDAFNSCCDLIYVNGLQSISSIGERAFYNCISLNGIDSYGSYIINKDSFSGCTSLKILYLCNITTTSTSSTYAPLVNACVDTVICDNIPSNLSSSLLSGTFVKVLDIRSDYYPKMDPTVNTPAFKVPHDYVNYVATGSNTGTFKENYAINRLAVDTVYAKVSVKSFADKSGSTGNAGFLQDNGFIKKIVIEEYVHNDAPTMSMCNRLSGLVEFSGEPITKLTCGILNDCRNLHTINLPYFTGINLYTNNRSSEIFFSNLPSIKTLRFPELKYIRSDSSTITKLNFVVNCPELTSFDAPNFTGIYGYLTQDASAPVLNNLPKLTTINVPQLTTWINGMFNKSSLQNVTIPSCATIIHDCLVNISTLEQIVISDGAKVTWYNGGILSNFAQTCPKLTKVYLPASFDVDDGTSTSIDSKRMFYNCSNLTTIELGQGYSKTLYLKHIKTLTKSCVVNMLNALADLTDQESKTLYLYSSTLSLLTTAEKAIATNKNWTLG